MNTSCLRRVPGVSSSIGGLLVGLGLTLASTVSASALTAALPDVLIFAGGNVALSGPTSIIGGSVEANGNITVSAATVQGNVTAHGTASTSGGAVVTGSVTSGAAALAVVSMQNIVDNLNSLSIAFILGPVNTNFTATNLTANGIYLVDGDVTINSTFHGTATFISNHNINIQNGASIVGDVAVSALFPKGLALFSGTGTVSYGNTGGDIADGASSVTGAIYDANNNVTINTNQDVFAPPQGGGHQETPLPAALPLFASAGGLFGLLGWRRKRKLRLSSK